MSRLCLTRTAIASALMLAALHPAFAGDGGWSRLEHSSVRLVPGGRLGDALLAGLEIELPDGWKTYWRMPGESGVPPSFDWSKSENVARVDVEWPAPLRIESGDGETVGYKGHVILPLLVHAKEAGKPARLDLDLFYAVCKDLCIPAKAKLQASLAEAGDPVDRTLIERYRALVPETSVPMLDVADVTLGQDDKGLSLDVRIAGANRMYLEDIFVEGPEFAYFRQPAMKDTGASHDSAIFSMPVDGVTAPEELRGKPVTLTIVTSKGRLVHEATIR